MGIPGLGVLGGQGEQTIEQQAASLAAMQSAMVSNPAMMQVRDTFSTEKWLLLDSLHSVFLQREEKARSFYLERDWRGLFSSFVCVFPHRERTLKIKICSDRHVGRAMQRLVEWRLAGGCAS